MISYIIAIIFLVGLKLLRLFIMQSIFKDFYHSHWPSFTKIINFYSESFDLHLSSHLRQVKLDFWNLVSPGNKKRKDKRLKKRSWFAFGEPEKRRASSQKLNAWLRLHYFRNNNQRWKRIQAPTMNPRIILKKGKKIFPTLKRKLNWKQFSRVLSM